MKYPDKTIKVVYIGGYGRSGTTLLDRILGQITGFFSAGELRHIWERGFRENQLCGCGRPFRSCDFWNAVGDDAFGGLAKVDVEEVLLQKRCVDRLRYIPALKRASKSNPEQRFGKHLHEYSAILKKLYSSIQNVSGADVIVDSSKDPPYGFLLRALPFIDFRLIHMVRDSRAVAYSWSRSKVRPEITDRQELMPRFRPTKSALKWDLYNFLLGALSSYTMKKVSCLYEELIEDPTHCVHKLLTDLGFNPPQGLSHIHGREVRLNLTHTVSGNPVRFETGAINLILDQEWENKMSKASKFLVTTLTWPILFKYGYLRRTVETR